MADVMERLTVHTERMRANVEATHGAVLAERAMLLLSARLGKPEAQKQVAEALSRVLREGRALVDILGEIPEVRRVLSGDELRDLGRPEHYLGEAEALRRELLGRASGTRPE
jgi:3-carboxy-cis,cis-muconate cycloisomerase